jgi:hypothetical protein
LAEPKFLPVSLTASPVEIKLPNGGSVRLPIGVGEAVLVKVIEGMPSRVDPTGQAGTYVSNEIDFVVNLHLTAHQDILIGYSKLFAGPNVSPDLFYLQHQLRW